MKWNEIEFEPANVNNEIVVWLLGLEFASSETKNEDRGKKKTWKITQTHTHTLIMCLNWLTCLCVVFTNFVIS